MDQVSVARASFSFFLSFFSFPGTICETDARVTTISGGNIKFTASWDHAIVRHVRITIQLWFGTHFVSISHRFPPMSKPKPVSIRQRGSRTVQPIPSSVEGRGKVSGDFTGGVELTGGGAVGDCFSHFCILFLFFLSYYCYFIMRGNSLFLWMFYMAGAAGCSHPPSLHIQPAFTHETRRHPHTDRRTHARNTTATTTDVLG